MKPADPVTREAVERFLREHGWEPEVVGLSRTAWHRLPQKWFTDERWVVTSTRRYDYADLLITEHGIFGRIA